VTAIRILKDPDLAWWQYVLDIESTYLEEIRQNTSFKDAIYRYMKMVIIEYIDIEEKTYETDIRRFFKYNIGG
jgi:hypothetical protein